MSGTKEATDAELQEVTQIGKRFRSYLVHCDLTFAQAATLLEVSPSMITRLADGVNMTVDILGRIVNTFPNLNTEWLLSGEGTMIETDLDKSSKEYLTGAATQEEVKLLAQLRKDYTDQPAWQHGPIVEKAVECLQAFMDEAMYLDRIGLLVQRKAGEFLRFHKNLQ